MENVIIRKTKAGDAEQYIKLRNLIWKSTYGHIFPEELFVKMENPENISKRIEGFAAYHIGNPQVFSYVAEDNGKIIGFMTGSYDVETECFKKPNLAELGCMYIHPEYQGKGLGSRFKDVFLKEIMSKGKQGFVLGVLKENVKAQKVYVAWGGELSERTLPYKTMGKTYDLVFYTYDLEKTKEKNNEKTNCSTSK